METFLIELFRLDFLARSVASCWSSLTWLVLAIAVDDLRTGPEVQIGEDEESDPGNPADDHDVLGPVRQSHTAGGVEVRVVRWGFPARKAMEIKVLFVIIWCAQILALRQGLYKKRNRNRIKKWVENPSNYLPSRRPSEPERSHCKGQEVRGHRWTLRPPNWRRANRWGSSCNEGSSSRHIR